MEHKLKNRLARRQRDTLPLWAEVRRQMPWRVSDKEWDAFLGTTARPLTWALWEIAAEEAAAIDR